MSEAVRAGLIDAGADVLSVVAAVEAMAEEAAAPAVVIALHSAALAAVAAAPGRGREAGELASGRVVGALTLSTEAVPVAEDHHVAGRTSWVCPLTKPGLAIVAGRHRGELLACGVALDHPGVRVEPIETAALGGVTFGHLQFTRVPSIPLGSPLPVMARVRLLLAAAGLGMGRRALRVALAAARGHTGHGAGGEQTVQGLLADAATELDAARLLVGKAAAGPLSLADASMAKLAATDAAQRAVVRATQVVGAETFRRGHVIERLAQDVRALELFAGRTEALRDAVAEQYLPPAR